jgi:hypothetical protein
MFISDKVEDGRYVAARSPLGRKNFLWWHVADDLEEMRVDVTDVPYRIRRMAYRRMKNELHKRNTPRKVM